MAESTQQVFIERGTVAYRKATLALFCAGFATFALLYCVQPLLPQLAEAFQVSAATSSLALSSTTLSLACCLLVAGALSESWGRKPIMAIGLLLACALGIACALVRDWHSLLVLRTLLGIALSTLPALAMAYVGEEFSPRSLPVAMGLYVGGTALGGLLGRLLAGWLSDLGGWSLALGGISGLGALACLLFIWLLPPAQHFQPQPFSIVGLSRNFKTHLLNPQLRRLFLLSFLLMGSFVALFNYIGFHLLQQPFALSSTVIGLLFLVYLFGMVSANWSGRLVQRFGAKPVLNSSLGLMLLGVLLCLTQWLPSVILGLSLFTIGFFAAHAVASGLVGQKACSAKAQASALYLCTYYLGSSALGYSSGWIWDHFNWNWLILFLATVLLGALYSTRKL